MADNSFRPTRHRAWFVALVAGSCVALLPSTSATASRSPVSAASGSADLKVTVAPATPTGLTGDIGVMRVRVRNNGPDAAEGVQVSLSAQGFGTIPYLEVTPSKGSCGSAGSSEAVCDLGTMTPGVTVSVRIRIPLTAPGTGRLVATAASRTPDPLGTQRDADGMTITGAACTVVGRAGDETLTGTSAVDVLCGFDGEDTLAGLNGDDELLGGPGSDVADYARASAGVYVSLKQQLSLRGAGSDSLRSIKGVQGSEFGDTLEGSDERDVFFGNGGSDDLSGSGGDDALFGGADPDDLDGGTGADRCVSGYGSDPDVLSCES
jgi:hypothetical protein